MASADSGTNRATEEPPYPPPGYAWYVVGVLMLIYVFSFMDRQILGLLVEPIKRDLQISDTQMSYLMGLSFAVFYTFFGIPLGRLADSTSRRGLIAAGLFFWSLMTAGCGTVTRYWQLMLLRMGVGVGEATLSPASYSLISDLFPRNKLGTAIGVYAMGIYFGSGLAYVFGGAVRLWVGDQQYIELPLLGSIYSWQVVFLMLGLPGLALTALLWTVREPFRRGVRRIGAEGRTKTVQVPLPEVIAYLRRNWRTLACHNVGFALIALSSYGTTAWIPSFFVRTHGWEVATAGIWYGTIVATCGTSGVFFGGWLSDRLSQGGVSAAKMKVGAFSAAIWGVSGVLYPLVDNGVVAMLLLIPTVFLASMPFGLAPAAIQEMMPNAMRAQASAIYLFVVNLIGLGLGPSVVAWITDYGFGQENMLRYSLLIVTCAAHLTATVLLWRGIRPFLASLKQLDEWTAENLD